MMNSSKLNRKDVMPIWPDLLPKSTMPSEESLNSKPNSMRKSPSETKKSEFSEKRKNGEITWSTKSPKSMPKKFWKTKNGPKNRNNTTKLNTLSKKLKPSSLNPWKPTLSYKKETPPSPKFLPTSPNTPKPTSKENLGPKSSTCWPKSPAPPPSKPTNPPSKELLTYVTPY